MFVATIVGDCGVHLHASTRLMALVCRMALVNAGRRCLVLVLDAARARHSPLPTTRAWHSAWPLVAARAWRST